jgi:hypothetical protein
VNITSLASHASMALTLALAPSTASRHGVANACPLDGFPKCSNKNGAIALATSGQMGVVAL